MKPTREDQEAFMSHRQIKAVLRDALAKEAKHTKGMGLRRELGVIRAKMVVELTETFEKEFERKSKIVLDTDTYRVG